jgi:hypothetical protein
MNWKISFRISFSYVIILTLLSLFSRIPAICRNTYCRRTIYKFRQSDHIIRVMSFGHICHKQKLAHNVWCIYVFLLPYKYTLLVVKACNLHRINVGR